MYKLYIWFLKRTLSLVSRYICYPLHKYGENIRLENLKRQKEANENILSILNKDFTEGISVADFKSYSKFRVDSDRYFLKQAYGSKITGISNIIFNKIQLFVSHNINDSITIKIVDISREAGVLVWKIIPSESMESK